MTVLICFVKNSTETPKPQAEVSEPSDLFGDFLSGNVQNSSANVQQQETTNSSSTSPTADIPTGNSLAQDPEGVNLFAESTSTEVQRQAKKDDIMKLYGNGANQQSFGVPGRL